MWWHIQSLVWGEGKVAEYMAKLRTWLATPSQYRGRDAPTIKQSLHQSEWHLKAQTKLMQLEEELDQQEGEILPLEGELCTPGQYMGLHDLVWVPMNHIMDQVFQEPPHPIKCNLFPKTIKVKHTLGKLKGLSSNHISDFNINWQISDLTETNFSLELIKETPARTWKYLTQPNSGQRAFHTLLLKAV